MTRRVVERPARGRKRLSALLRLRWPRLEIVAEAEMSAEPMPTAAVEYARAAISQYARPIPEVSAELATSE